MVRCSNPGKENTFVSPPKRPDGLWVPSSLLFNGYRRSVAWLSWPGRDVDPSPPSSAKVKNEWSCTSVSPCTFMMWTGTTFLFHSYSLARVSRNIKSSPPSPPPKPTAVVSEVLGSPSISEGLINIPAVDVVACNAGWCWNRFLW